MDIQLYTVAIDSSKLSFQNGQWQQEKPWQMSIFFFGDFTKANFYRIKDLIYIRFFIFYQSQYLNSL